MRLRLRRVITSGMVGWIGLAACTERPSRPTTLPGYYVYAGIHEVFDSWIAVIDTETDSLVDSLVYDGGWGNTYVVASEDGRYVSGTPTGFKTRVWDATTGLPIKDLDSTEVPLFWDATSLVTSSNYQVRFYTLPSFVLDTIITANLGAAQRLGVSDTIVSINYRGPHSGVPDRSQLALVDLKKRQIIDSFVINPDEDGFGFQIIRYDTSPQTRRLYALGNRGGGGTSILCLDLGTREVVFRNPEFAANGYCRVSPDGREVWYTVPINGLVVVLDAMTGITLDTIATTGFYPDSLKRLAPQNILFRPGTEPHETKAYVNCGGFDYGKQPLLVIDVKTRSIEKTLFSDFGKLAEFIDIGPKP